MTNFPAAFALRNAITWNRRAIQRATKQRRLDDVARYEHNITELEARLAA